MQNSKLIQLLRQLNTSQWTGLRRFLHNREQGHPDTVKLLDFLQPYGLGKKNWNQLPERTILAAKWYPQHSTPDQELNYRLSELQKVVEQYLADWLPNPEADWSKQLRLLQFFSEKDLPKHYRYQLKRLRNSFSLSDPDFYFKEYELARQEGKHFLLQRQRKDDRGALQKSADFLLMDYVRRQLAISCEMLDRQQSLSTTYQPHITESLIQQYQQLPQQHPLTEAYLELYRMLSTSHRKEEAIRFDQFFHRLRTGHRQIEPSFLRELYYFAINHCVRKIRANQTGYEERLLELYTEGVSTRLLFENDQLSPWTFKNMVKLGVRLQRLKWAEEFIENYVSFLPENFREDARQYNRAELFYQRGQFREATHHLLRVGFSDPYYHLDAKVMLCKIYFESEEWDALFSLMAAFRVYLNRLKGVSSQVRKAYQQFVSCLNALQKVVNREQRKKLQARIKGYDSLTERTWLLEKLKQI